MGFSSLMLVSMMSLKNKNRYPSNILERFLLFATIGVLPLQWYYPTFGGMGIGFIVFSISTVYLLMFRLRMLRKILLHPVFLAGYALVTTGIFMELAHDSNGYPEVLRIFLMLLGAIVIATLCRDRKAVQWAIFGYLFAGVWLSFILIQTTYGTLSTAKADDFRSASHLRQSVYEANPLDADPNTMAFFAGQGAIVALGLGLMAGSHWLRGLFIGLGAFCLVATFLPMSRGGVLVLGLSCAVMMYAHGIMKPRIFIAAGILAIGMMVWVPDVVFQRFTLSGDTRIGAREEGRTRVYSAVVKHLPEYALVGVGISHYYGKWGRQTKLWKDYKVTGTHNCFAQITVYWGVAGLLSLVILIWQAYLCIPSFYKNHALTLCLVGIAVSVLGQVMLVHTLYAKEFSLLLGILVGGSYWMWPKSVALARPKTRRISFKGTSVVQGHTSVPAPHHE